MYDQLIETGKTTSDYLKDGAVISMAVAASFYVINKAQTAVAERIINRGESKLERKIGEESIL